MRRSFGRHAPDRGFARHRRLRLSRLPHPTPRKGEARPGRGDRRARRTSIGSRSPHAPRNGSASRPPRSTAAPCSAGQTAGSVLGRPLRRARDASWAYVVDGAPLVFVRQAITVDDIVADAAGDYAVLDHRPDGRARRSSASAWPSCSAPNSKSVTDDRISSDDRPRGARIMMRRHRGLEPAIPLHRGGHGGCADVLRHRPGPRHAGGRLPGVRPATGRGPDGLGRPVRDSEIESLVTIPLEQALQGIAGTRRHALEVRPAALLDRDDPGAWDGPPRCPAAHPGTAGHGHPDAPELDHPAGHDPAALGDEPDDEDRAVIRHDRT